MGRRDEHDGVDFPGDEAVSLPQAAGRVALPEACRVIKMRFPMMQNIHFATEQGHTISQGAGRECRPYAAIGEIGIDSHADGNFVAGPGLHAVALYGVWVRQPYGRYVASHGSH